MTIVVSDLIGLRAWGLAYAAKMPMIQFGSPRPSRSPSGRERVTGEYALHVQCHWAIILAGLRHETNIALDAANNALGSALAIEPRVVAAHDDQPVTRIALENGTILELDSASCAEDEESWRILRPGGNEPHLVRRGRSTGYE